MQSEPFNVYEFVGGEPTFQQLVDTFYEKVAHDDILRPLFPPDLEEGKLWQKLFLMQYWGGPADYMAQRGHPRLRMRHFPFTITPLARDRWVEHMLTSLDDVGIAEPARSLMRDYFERAGTAMINTHEETS